MNIEITQSGREFYPGPSRPPALMELEDQLTILEACLKLSENDDRAIVVKFSMVGNDKSVDHWVEKNSNLRPFLLQEIEDTKKLIQEETAKSPD